MMAAPDARRPAEGERPTPADVAARAAALAAGVPRDEPPAAPEPGGSRFSEVARAIADEAQPVAPPIGPPIAGVTPPADGRRDAQRPRPGTQRAALLAWFERNAWAEITADQVAEVFPHWSPATVAKRVGDLVHDGWLEPTGRTRETRYGKQARVVRLRRQQAAAS